METLEKVVLPILILAGVIIMVIALLNFLLKKQIINSGISDPEYIKLLNSSLQNKSSALKWALIFLFAGGGLFVIGSLDHYSTPVPFAIELIAVALALFTFYFLTRRSNL